jgi:hypothetical protein
MTVNEAIAALVEAREKGHGDKPLKTAEGRPVAEFFESEAPSVFALTQTDYPFAIGVGDARLSLVLYNGYE